MRIGKDASLGSLLAAHPRLRMVDILIWRTLSPAHFSPVFLCMYLRSPLLLLKSVAHELFLLLSRSSWTAFSSFWRGCVFVFAGKRLRAASSCGTCLQQHRGPLEPPLACCKIDFSFASEVGRAPLQNAQQLARSRKGHICASTFFFPVPSERVEVATWGRLCLRKVSKFR